MQVIDYYWYFIYFVRDGLGLCTLRASQAGNLNYAPAANVDANVTVGLGVQLITFPSQSPAERELVAGGTFAISPLATGGDCGNPVTYTSTSAGICFVSGAVVTMLTTGICTIAANQLGNLNYRPALAAISSVTISRIRPVVTAASVGGNGTISPAGEIIVARGSEIDFTINANARYKAVVAGSCGGRIVTSVALTPRGAGIITYRTDAVGGDCNVLVSFVAMQPTLTISGSSAITLVNTSPPPSYSEVSRPAVFTASLKDAVALLNLN